MIEEEKLIYYPINFIPDNPNDPKNSDSKLEYGFNREPENIPISEGNIDIRTDIDHNVESIAYLFTFLLELDGL